MATILQIANADKNLSNFSKGLKLSGLEDKLNESGPFTILGPVNLAFGKLGSANLEELFLPANNKKLTDLLSSHILSGKNMLTDFMPGKKLKTINGKEVTVNIKNGEIHINDARILAKDRQGKNGVVHSLDTFFTVS
jgi:uncharacterized surface protein with fasciclin (FAS1) repeats